MTNANTNSLFADDLPLESRAAFFVSASIRAFVGQFEGTELRDNRVCCVSPPHRIRRRVRRCPYERGSVIVDLGLGQLRGGFDPAASKSYGAPDEFSRKNFFVGPLIAFCADF